MDEAGIRDIVRQELAAFVTRGVVSDSRMGGRAMVQATGLDGEIFANLELVQPHGVSGLPAPGADILILGAAGRKDGALALMGDMQGAHLADAQPGDRALCNGAAHVAVRTAGQVEHVAPGSVAVSAPGFSCDGNVRMGTGATGVMSSPTGQMMIVRSGRVDTITMPDGSGAVTNPDALQKLIAEIKACGDCAFLQKIEQEIASEEQTLLTSFTAQIAALGEWLELLIPPDPTPQAILDYLKKVIKIVFGSQFTAQSTCIQQMVATIQEVAEVPAAFVEAAGRIGQCLSAFPTMIVPPVPPLPVAPPGALA